jgi:transposase
MPRKKRIHGDGSANVAERHQKTIGLDTDSRFIVAAFYNANFPKETITTEYAQSQMGMKELIRDCQNFKPELIIIESTANYHMLAYDSLSKAGLPIVVINPSTVKALLRVEGKSDKGDAVTLARVGAGFSLRASNMPNEFQRRLRAIFSIYDTAKVERIRLHAKMSAQLTAVGITLSRNMTSDSIIYWTVLEKLAAGKPSEEIVGAISRKDTAGRVRNSLPESIPPYIVELLPTWLKQIETTKQIEQEAKEKIMSFIDAPEVLPLVDRLLSVPCMTEFLILRLLAECGDNYWMRFPTSGAFVKAIGVCPANEVSGGKLLKRKSSHGNIRIKIHLLQAVKAWAMVPKEHPLYRWFMGYRAKAGYMKATSGVARIVAEGCYEVARRGEYWKYKGRWIKHDDQWVDTSKVDINTGEVK